MTLAPQVGTQSPHHGVLTPPRGSTGGSFHAEPPSPSVSWPSLTEQRLHSPRAPVSSLSQGVCPLPHFSCSMVGGPRGPSSPLGKAPHQLCPCGERRPLQDQLHCPGGPAKPKWDAPSCLEYCTSINAVAAQIPSRHNPPGLRINFILNQLAARPSPSQPVSTCAHWLPSPLPKLLQFASWTQEPGKSKLGHTHPHPSKVT